VTLALAAAAAGCRAEVTHLECFRPARPEPTYRFDSVADVEAE
jgi:hypothetical protein